MKIRALLALACGFMYGCTDKPPVAESDANIYQKSVYFNDNRPRADKKRDNERRPAEILEFVGVQPGDVVIDLLGGSGWYTEILSNLVTDTGHVYVVNTPLFNNFAGEDLTKRLKAKHLSNVTRLNPAWDNLDLPQNVDVIWLALSYHDIYVKRPNRPEFEADRDHFFEQMRSALKPGGLLLITDHAAHAGTGIAAAGKQHRIDEAFAKQDISNEGFEFIKSTPILRTSDDNYSLDIWNKEVYRKTDRFVHLYKRSL